MLERIGAVGDRLLAVVVPKTQAAAQSCWWEYWQPNPTFCRKRIRCSNGYIGDWQYC